MGVFLYYKIMVLELRFMGPMTRVNWKLGGWRIAGGERERGGENMCKFNQGLRFCKDTWQSNDKGDRHGDRQRG